MPSIGARVAYLVVVVAQGSAQLVIVHVGLVLAQPPQLGHFLWLEQLELAVVGRPADEVLVALVEQKLQQELPECDGALHDGTTPETRAICRGQRRLHEITSTKHILQCTVKTYNVRFCFLLDWEGINGMSNQESGPFFFVQLKLKFHLTKSWNIGKHE